MLQKSLLYLTIIIGMFILLPGNVFSKHDSGNLATIEYPEHNQKVPFEVVNIIVQLEEAADHKTFKARLNGKNITNKFDYDDYRNRMTATVGHEDGLRVKKKKGKNTLEIEIKSDKKHKKKKDKDSRKFFVTGSSPPTVCDDLSGKPHGLCYDYCEELDCDWDPNASERKCDKLRSRYSSITGEPEFPCETISLGCVTGDSGEDPPFPFDVDDRVDYGDRVLELTVPEQCECDPSDSDCTPCPIVVGFHGYGQTGTSPYSWKSRLEGKGAAVGFISLYPTGDMTPNSYTPSGTDPNWAVPSCQEFKDGCTDEVYCDWCGDINEDDDVSTQREIEFTRAIVKWTMDNHCVDPGQIFATGYSNGGLWSHTLARHPDTSGLFKALVPVDGVDQAGVNDHLKWIHAPQNGDSPWILHVNEIFDRFEPYDGRPYDDYVAWGWPEWIYPPVLQIFAEYLKNDAYSACGFGPDDVGDRFGEFVAGGVVPAGYRRLDGPNSLEGEGQEKFYCFTKDASGESCERLAICLWDSGLPGDDYPDPHGRAGREWSGGTDPGTGGTDPMDIMWRFMKASVGVPY